MAFKKGNQLGNRKGRPKGAKDKKTKIWNEIGEWFANEGIEKYQENLMEMMESKMTREDGMKRFEALLEYFRPKLSRAELSADIELKNESYDDWSKEDLEVMAKLRDKNK